MPALDVALPVASLAAGLLGSPHCVGMCGAFAASARTRPESVAWHAGRLSAYGVLGAAAGRAGHLAFDAGLTGVIVAGVLLVGFAGRMAGWWPALPARWTSRLGAPFARGAAAIARRGGLAGRLALGVTTALLPCGLLWSALAVAGTAGTTHGGALAMLGFGAGTLPALAAASALLRRLAATRAWVRHAVAIVLLLAGTATLGMRARAAVGGGVAEGGTPSAPSCH